jgi:hypothetical protein
MEDYRTITEIREHIERIDILLNSLQKSANYENAKDLTDIENVCRDLKTKTIKQVIHYKKEAGIETSQVVVKAAPKIEVEIVNEEVSYVELDTQYKVKLENINDEMKYINRYNTLLPGKDIGIVNDLLAKLYTVTKTISDESIIILSKQCRECGETHPRYFGKSVKSKCIQCTSKKTYIDSYKSIVENGKERNTKARLERGACKDCGVVVTPENATMFDWDHRNPVDKLFGIAKMNMKKDELFYNEIEKCDLVCSNCHAMRTKIQFEKKIIKTRPTNKELANQKKIKL